MLWITIQYGKPTERSNLTNCSHVWLRIRRVKRPLQPPYIGPYLVLSRHPKYLTIFRDCKSVNVSIDNVKPALDYDQYDDHRQTSFTSNLADISAYSTGQSVGTVTPPSSPCHDTKRKRKLPRRFDDFELYWNCCVLYLFVVLMFVCLVPLITNSGLRLT